MAKYDFISPGELRVYRAISALGMIAGDLATGITQIFVGIIFHPFGGKEISQDGIDNFLGREKVHYSTKGEKIEKDFEVNAKISADQYILLVSLGLIKDNKLCSQDKCVEIVSNGDGTYTILGEISLSWTIIPPQSGTRTVPYLKWKNYF